MRVALVSKKHSVVLFTAVVAEGLQRLATTPARGMAFDFFVLPVVLAIFLAVFDDRPQRAVGLGLGLAGLLTNWLHYVVDSRGILLTEAMHHGFMVGFFGFTAFAILQGIFRGKRVDADAVVGALCGYLFSGAAFAHLYTLVQLLSPQAFAVNPAIAWQLQDWHLRRFLFGYVSLVTLTSLGYSNVTPVLPTAQTITWMESVFGQFYLAVVVAQLVGMRMAPKPHGSPHPSEKQG